MTMNINLKINRLNLKKFRNNKIIYWSKRTNKQNNNKMIMTDKLNKRIQKLKKSNKVMKNYQMKIRRLLNNQNKNF